MVNNIQPFKYQETTNIDEHNQMVDKINELVDGVNELDISQLTDDVATAKADSIEALSVANDAISQVATKADQTTVTNLAGQVANKAEKATVDNLIVEVDAKADITTVNDLSVQLNDKASVASVNTLSSQLAGKADTTTVNGLASQLEGKADVATVTELESEIASKADSSTVSELSSQLATKANQSEVINLAETVEKKANQIALDNEIQNRTANDTNIRNSITALESEVDANTSAIAGINTELISDVIANRPSAGKIQIQIEKENGTPIDSNILDMVIPTDYTIISGATARSFKIQIQYSDGSTATTNDMVIPEGGGTTVSITSITLVKQAGDNSFIVRVGLDDGSSIDSNSIAMISSVSGVFTDNKLTISVNGISSIPINIPIPTIPPTTVSGSFNDVSDELRVTVNGVQSAPIEIPIPTIPETTVSGTFDNATNNLRVTVNGVQSAPINIPDTPIPATTVSGTFDDNTDNLRITVNGTQSAPIKIPLPTIPETEVALNYSSNQLTFTVNGVTSNAVTISTGSSYIAGNGITITGSTIAINDAIVLTKSGAGSDYMDMSYNPSAVSLSVSGSNLVFTLTREVGNLTDTVALSSLITSVSGSVDGNNLVINVNGKSSASIPVVKVVSGAVNGNNLTIGVNAVSSGNIPVVKSVTGSVSGNNLTIGVNGVNSSPIALPSGGDITVETVKVNTLENYRGKVVMLSQTDGNFVGWFFSGIAVPYGGSTYVIGSGARFNGSNTVPLVRCEGDATGFEIYGTSNNLVVSANINTTMTVAYWDNAGRST